MAKTAGPGSNEDEVIGRRRYGTTQDDLAQAALRVSQRVGVNGVTMKLVGEELGLSPMAPYRHVRSRDQLLEIAAQAVLRRVINTAPSEGSWDQRLRTVLQCLQAACEPYPWVGPYLASHAPVAIGSDESPTFRILRDAGLDEDEALLELSFINAFVVGMMLGSAHHQSRPGLSPGRTKRADVSGEDINQHWHYGIEMIVTGLRARLAGRDAGPGWSRGKTCRDGT